MKVSNIHCRTLPITLESAGPLIDSLASKQDLLWPKENWPAMRFDRPLAVGATGGHGAIRYFVNEYEPGRCLGCTFTSPKGFDGTHSFRLDSVSESDCKLTHTIDMDTTGLASVLWLLMIRPLHDALVEDALFLAERFAGVENPSKTPWSPWVFVLRALWRRVFPRTK